MRNQTNGVTETAVALGSLFDDRSLLLVSPLRLLSPVCQYNCMLLVALTNYITQLVSFLILRWQFTMLTRGYHSWWGVPGAILGILIFGFTFIALLGWGTKIWIAVICIVIYMGIGLC